MCILYFSFSLYLMHSILSIMFLSSNIPPINFVIAELWSLIFAYKWPKCLFDGSGWLCDNECVWGIVLPSVQFLVYI